MSRRRRSKKNVVHVVDPYFGPYVRVEGETQPVYPDGGYNWWSPTFYVGPTRSRIIDIEQLDNVGPRHGHKGAYEKSCKHVHVRGTIVNTLPDDGDTRRCPFGYGDMTTFWADISHCYAVDTADWQDTTWYSWEDDQYYFQMAVSTGVVQVLDYYWFPGLRNVPLGCLKVRCYLTVYFKAATFPYSKAWRFGMVLTPYIDPDGNIGRAVPRFWEPALGGCSIMPMVSFPFGVPPEGYTCPDLKTLRLYVEEVQKNRCIEPRGNTVRDEALYRALDDLTVGDRTNMLELLRDLEDPKAVVNILRTFQRARKGGPPPVRILKVLAALHLWWKYVVKTGWMTVEDLRSIARDVWIRREQLAQELEYFQLVGRGKFIGEVVSDDDGSTTVIQTAKVVYNHPANTISGWIDTLNALGLAPRLTDIWDLIPYSFVVDWVVPVDRAIGRLELNSLQQCLPFDTGILGRKIIWNFSRDLNQQGDYALKVNIEGVGYKREVISEFPSDVWFGKLFTDPRKQLLTAGALAVQYLSGSRA